jgi:amidase
MFKEYDQYDATGLAELVKTGQVSAAELLDEAIDRAEKVNPALNFLVQPMYDIAREAARQTPLGPFAGVPFLLKDLLASYAGVPMMQGSRFTRGFIPTEDSEYVRRFKASGVNIFGKSATPEFGITPSTEPELTGPCRNPWNTAHSPGGSSGGASAAVASGVVPMASASDGGGSIRIPASCCGLFGLKPSRGRVPSGPDAADGWFGFIAEHVVSRSVRDSAIMLDTLQGDYPAQLLKLAPPKGSYLDAMSHAPGKLRIAYSTDPCLGLELDPEVKSLVEQTAHMLRALGHEVEEVSLPIERDDFIFNYSVLIASEINATISHWEKHFGRKARASDFELRTWGIKKMGDAFDAGDVSTALWSMHQFSRRWMNTFQPYDVLLTSTLGALPVEVGGLLPGTVDAVMLKALGKLPIGQIAKRREFVVKAAERVYNYCSQTMPANVTGQPSMSVPLHASSSGLPVGMMFTSRFGDEATLFSLARQLEIAHPWAHRRPPVWAGS